MKVTVRPAKYVSFMDFKKLLTHIAYYIASMSVVVKGGKLGKAVNASSQSLSNLTFYNILLAMCNKCVFGMQTRKDLFRTDCGV